MFGGAPVLPQVCGGREEENETGASIRQTADVRNASFTWRSCGFAPALCNHLALKCLNRYLPGNCPTSHTYPGLLLVSSLLLVPRCGLCFPRTKPSSALDGSCTWETLPIEDTDPLPRANGVRQMLEHHRLRCIPGTLVLGLGDQNRSGCGKTMILRFVSLVLVGSHQAEAVRVKCPNEPPVPEWCPSASPLLELDDRQYSYPLLLPHCTHHRFLEQSKVSLSVDRISQVS